MRRRRLSETEAREKLGRSMTVGREAERREEESSRGVTVVTRSERASEEE